MFEKIKYSINKTKRQLKQLAILMSYEKNKEYSDNVDKKIILKKPKRIVNVLSGKEFNIDYIELVLTTVCNLKCRGCSALMYCYEKPYHIDVNKNIKALSKIADSCDSVNLLRLLGGESFCYPYLYDLLLYILKEDKFKRVGIVTNGTFLINDEKIIEILKNKKFYVFISNYGDISKNYNQLIEQLKQNNINYIPMKRDYKWVDYGKLECRERSKKELKKQFSKCGMTCKSILDGKLYHCPRNSHGTNLKKIPLKGNDYIDLFDENITKNELRKKIYSFFYKYIPYIEACNYCNRGTNETKIIPAGEQCENKF